MSNGGVARTDFAEDTVGSLAQQSILRDLDDDPSLADESDDDEDAISTTSGAAISRTVSHQPSLGEHSLVAARRPSYVVSGPRPLLGTQQPDMIIPLNQEQAQMISEERTLLRDNNLIPPKQSRRRSSQASLSSRRSLKHRISMPQFLQPQTWKQSIEEVATPAAGAAETSPLLDGQADSVPVTPGAEDIDKKFNEAVEAGEIVTTWRREAKVLTSYSAPLILTFLLQQSLIITSVFTVGHIGKIELGAVSLGGMTANITGYALYHGATTALDTLCAQAYGSGNKKLVGLNMQRMILMLWTITIPIAALWLAGTQILAAIVPEREVAELAGLYLKILIIGAPGYAAFESAKRYVQAQGRFAANFYVLIIAAPVNIFLHWLFVWKLGWGFVGCPIAIVIVETAMPLMLLVYVRFTGAMECWPGFTMRAFHNWGPMIRLAVPGLVMVFAEFLAFEILTLASARISGVHLAAQAILQSLSVLMYQLPFPLSIAGSTRVANMIGAGLPDAAKVTAKVMFWGGTLVGLFNLVFLYALRNYIPRLYSDEADVVALAAATLPVNAAFQLFDALAAQCNGLLRGLGKQYIGGYVSLLAFYAVSPPFLPPWFPFGYHADNLFPQVALPISFGTAFGLHWDLIGLWAGPAIALLVQTVAESIFIVRTDWHEASDMARMRNLAG